MEIAGSAFLVALVVGVGFAAVATWRQRSAPDPTDRTGGFRPSIGFTRLDGMASLSLLLANRSRDHVWAEEIEILLSSLAANDQTAEPTYREIQKIRQMVPPRDMLPISLAGVIYKAAGDPQRKYSGVLSSVLRFRIGDEWNEKQLDNYRIRMMGLTAVGVRRERGPVAPFATKAVTESADVPASAKLK